MASFTAMLADVRGCTICAEHLPHGVRPVLQIHPDARVLIAGQAPGRKVHESGVPFDDASGERLREWMGVTRKVFYDPKQVAILPMGLCFPGSKRSGDLPPRPECAPAWRAPLLARLLAGGCPDAAPEPEEQHLALAQSLVCSGGSAGCSKTTVRGARSMMPSKPLDATDPGDE